jgi:hypothetical protein
MSPSEETDSPRRSSVSARAALGRRRTPSPAGGGSKALRLGLVLLAVCAACRKPPALTQETVRVLVESSAAFQAPIDFGVVFMDSNLRVGQNTKREFLKVESVVVKPDGPFGAAGSTATVVFTWRWNGGPLAGRTFRSQARLNSTSGSWKLYDDYLKHQLSIAEGAEE